MFVLTVFAYPCVLAALCLGAALLVDRLSGGFLPAMLLPAVGAATLIALSQLVTYVAPIAPATPPLMAAVAVAGFALGWRRALAFARRARACAWQLLVPVLAYLLALAPVILAGRPTFSSYMALTDSAVHLIGADFLLHHGQDYAHLDLRGSYGQYIAAYYGAGYPSGADTLFGGSAMLLGLPLIWAFQPFNAFMLATASGPACLLVRRIGLDGAWAAAAALTVTVPVLVYAYELIGSIKEITALPMILGLGALVVLHPRWLHGGARGAIPFALLVAGGVSAIGVAFGAWALAAEGALVVVAGGEGALAPAAVGAAVVLVCAWPTWIHLAGSLQVAQAIAATSNSGNLHTPLHLQQALGTWLSGSYKLLPKGGAREVTYALVAIALCAALLGTAQVVRRGARALGGWIVLTLAAWLGLTAYGGTWTSAKTLMLTSPLLLLLAWGGVAALRTSRGRPLAPLLALALAGGVLSSDAMLYHSANLAPTARYRELASLNDRFAGEGPTLFTDYDEYAMYELRDLDVAGPNFIYPPAVLRGLVARNGDPVDLSRVLPTTLRSYPLILTRRDPAAARPPAAYRLLWQGTYYQVWGRQPGAAPAIARARLLGSLARQCSVLARVARVARSHDARLVAANVFGAIAVALAHARRPLRWTYGRVGLTLSGPGRLQAGFAVPRRGEWDVWLQGEVMRPVRVGVDGRVLASIGGEVGGSSLTQQTMPPLSIDLSAGRHTLSVTRGGASLAPGDGGWADLRAILLTPARTAGQETLQAVDADRWRSLCGRPLAWVEAMPRGA